MKKNILKIVIIFFIIGIIISGGIAIYFYFKTPTFAIPTYVSVDYDLQKESFAERDVYILSDKENRNNQYILFLHGGAYTTNLTSDYWEFFAGIVSDTGATIIIPDYPLAPEYCYQDVFDMIVPLYEELIQKVGGDNLIVMGDSAGGGLSLALCEYEGEKEFEQPSQLLLISPWLDVTMTNDSIEDVQPYDQELNVEVLKIAAAGYARGTDEKDYRISPINGPVENLKNVVIYTGTYDILNPDAKRFVEIAKEEGLDIDYREYDKAKHIWLLYYKDESVYMAKEGYNDLIQMIKEGAKK